MGVGRSDIGRTSLAQHTNSCPLSQHTSGHLPVQQFANGIAPGRKREEFNRTLGQRFAALTFDTAGAQGMNIIPYRTRKEKDGITAVVVVFGRKEVVFGGNMTLYFTILAEQGMDATRERVERGYGISMPRRLE